MVDITVQTARAAAIMGFKPKVALVSFSNFGKPMSAATEKIRKALTILDTMNLDFEYDGEISVDAALNVNLQKLYPFCRLKGAANVLIMPDLHSAAISAGLLQELAGGTFIGPILDGFEYPVQIATIGSSANEILKVAAFASIEAINAKI